MIEPITELFFSSMSYHHRLAHLTSKLGGSAPLCPWYSIAKSMHPGTWRIHPPVRDIQVIETTDFLHLLRFAGKHDFWFPRSMSVSSELWNEYLVVFWKHRLNAHYYIRHGIEIGQDDCVLDCGACEGFFTRLALDAGASKVICVEPSPIMIRCLHATFESEIRAQRVVIAPVALSSLCGEAGFTSEDNDAFSGHFQQDSVQRVKITTIDQLCAGDEKPTLIKMDLEGSEYEALRGATELIKTSHPKLAVTTYHNAWDHAVMLPLLRGLGYRHLKASAATLRGGTIPRPVMLYAW